MSWQPLQSHVDGLLLIVVVFSMLVPFLESRARLKGISLFALPLIVGMSCSSLEKVTERQEIIKYDSGAKKICTVSDD